MKLNYYSPSFLPADLGLIEIEVNWFSTNVSAAARVYDPEYKITIPKAVPWKVK
jgi:hypothetical protein